MDIVTKVLLDKEGVRRVRQSLAEAVLLALKMDDRAMCQGVRQPPEAGKGPEMDLTLETPEGTSPAHTLILATGTVINGCCFKSLSLYSFVRAVTGNKYNFESCVCH